MVDRKAITLTLTGWQQRMFGDHVRRQTLPTKLTIGVIDRRQWVMYRQPNPAAIAKGAWNLYLTDAQISKVAGLLGGARISALTISPDSLKSGAITFA